MMTRFRHYDIVRGQGRNSLGAAPKSPIQRRELKRLRRSRLLLAALLEYSWRLANCKAGQQGIVHKLMNLFSKGNETIWYVDVSVNTEVLGVECNRDKDFRRLVPLPQYWQHYNQILEPLPAVSFVQVIVQATLKNAEMHRWS